MSLFWIKLNMPLPEHLNLKASWNMQEAMKQDFTVVSPPQACFSNYAG